MPLPLILMAKAKKAHPVPTPEPPPTPNPFSGVREFLESYDKDVLAYELVARGETVESLQEKVRQVRGKA